MKLTDFGLSKDVSRLVDCKYLAQTDGQTSMNEELPIFWSSPESLRPPFIFSFATDVWATGITFWEVATDGGFPYYEWALGDEEFIHRLVNDRQVMSAPTVADGCPQLMAELMMDCWRFCPTARPAAAELAARLRVAL